MLRRGQALHCALQQDREEQAVRELWGIVAREPYTQPMDEGTETNIWLSIITHPPLLITKFNQPVCLSHCTRTMYSRMIHS
jgi:hypothetical protein